MEISVLATNAHNGSAGGFGTALVAFLALALFDAVIGGAVSALLSRDKNWTALDQRLNEIYQFTYATVIALTLIGLYIHLQQLRPILAMIILFLGYVEDTLYYLFLPLVKPLINLITRVEGRRGPIGGLFPKRIAGWIGWAGRIFFHKQVALKLSVVFLLNALAIFVVVVVWII
jgi:hypothetical protein